MPQAQTKFGEDEAIAMYDRLAAVGFQGGIDLSAHALPRGLWRVSCTPIRDERRQQAIEAAGREPDAEHNGTLVWGEP
jgi:hypothetical protein